MIRFASTAIILSLMSTPAFADAVKYDFDKSHSNLSFSYNHLGYSTTDGRFGDWDGMLMIDDAEPSASSVDFTIKADSLDTFWEARDTHFKGADFFDVKEFPEITFKSTKVEKVSETALQVTGDLTIKGITKPAVLEVNVLAFGEHPMGKKQAAGFDVTTVIKRSDYDMGKHVPYVGDEVSIVFSGETMIAE